VAHVWTILDSRAQGFCVAESVTPQYGVESAYLSGTVYNALTRNADSNANDDLR